MFIIICITLFVYTLLGKPTKHLVSKLCDINWSEKLSTLKSYICSYAEKVGRVAAKPILTFFYAMQSEDLSVLDRCLICGAFAYIVVPSDLLPTRVLGWLGVLDDAAALTYVYNKLEDKITPDIEIRVQETIDSWFGAEVIEIQTIDTV